MLLLTTENWFATALAMVHNVLGRPFHEPSGGREDQWVSAVWSDANPGEPMNQVFSKRWLPYCKFSATLIMLRHFRSMIQSLLGDL